MHRIQAAALRRGGGRIAHHGGGRKSEQAERKRLETRFARYAVLQYSYTCSASKRAKMGGGRMIPKARVLMNFSNTNQPAETFRCFMRSGDNCLNVGACTKNVNYKDGNRCNALVFPKTMTDNVSKN